MEIASGLNVASCCLGGPFSDCTIRVSESLPVIGELANNAAETSFEAHRVIVSCLSEFFKRRFIFERESKGSYSCCSSVVNLEVS
jgi:hypothetical protein